MQFKLCFAGLVAAFSVTMGTASSSPPPKSVQAPHNVNWVVQVPHKFDWGVDRVRGVNLGGWLVLEPFITPSIFEKHSDSTGTVIDEFTLCKKLGREHCTAVLENHWKTFITKDDLAHLLDLGINVIRIPIGYWSVFSVDELHDLGVPYAIGTLDFLESAINWASELHLKVIIDLHGAPGSQNGFDHSGQKMKSPQWTKGNNIPLTHKALKRLEDKFLVFKSKWENTIIGVGPLNEPFVNAPEIGIGPVKQFYSDSFWNLRNISRDMPVIFHDGFWTPTWMNGFLTPEHDNAHGVIVDHHEYQIFWEGGAAMSPEDHIKSTCEAAKAYTSLSQNPPDHWMLVGEWSGAMTDCTPHINGFKEGNRYEGTLNGAKRVGSCSGISGPVSNWTAEYKENVRKYLEVQLDVFERGTRGWIFWTLKTEGTAGEWDFLQLIKEGIFPMIGELKKICWQNGAGQFGVEQPTPMSVSAKEAAPTATTAADTGEPEPTQKLHKAEGSGFLVSAGVPLASLLVMFVFWG